MLSSSILETIMDPLTSSLHMGLMKKLFDTGSFHIATQNREKSSPIPPPHELFHQEEGLW